MACKSSDKFIVDQQADRFVDTGPREMTDIGRAAILLDALAESRRALTLSEMTARTGLPRSTVHRTMQQLERELYVVRIPGRPGYELGAGLLKFGMSAHLRLLAANRSRLIMVARAVNENAELAIFSGREAVVVDQLASPERLRGVTKVGRSFSLHASAIGAALLAQLPESTADNVLPAQLTRFTDRTVTDRAAIVGRLADVRRIGIAFDIEEHDIGICAVATGFVGPTGAVQAVSVVVPTARIAAKYDLAVEALARVNPAVDLVAARALALGAWQRWV